MKATDFDLRCNVSQMYKEKCSPLSHPMLSDKKFGLMKLFSGTENSLKFTPPFYS
jgi:hypothetical protein